MITIKEILKENIDEYWSLHWKYLNSDIFPYATLGNEFDEEYKEYFKSEEYRGVMEAYMDRNPDKAHFIYFYRDEVRIGCAQYVTYKSEDGKCFLMDFWVLPEHRGNSTGHECYYSLKEYVKRDDAAYFMINVSNERNHKFWSSIEFADNGFDEWREPLMRRDI